MCLEARVNNYGRSLAMVAAASKQRMDDIRRNVGSRELCGCLCASTLSEEGSDNKGSVSEVVYDQGHRCL